MSSKRSKPESKVEKTRQRFIEAVEKAGGGNAAAFQLGCSPSTVSLICTGKRDLSDIELALRIQTLFGIPMEDWVEDTEPQTVQRFAR